MPREICLSVDGNPASQGSHAVIRGRIVQVNSEKLKKWRKAIVDQAHAYFTEQEDWSPILGACRVEVTFFLPRPKTVTRALPIVPPDVDKISRGCLDALTTAGVYGDDSQVVELVASKVYADNRVPGAIIKITGLE